MRIKTHFRTRVQEHGVLIAVIFIGLIIFACRYAFVVWDSDKPDVFSTEVGKTINFQGIIATEPDKRENSTRLTIDVEKVPDRFDSSNEKKNSRNIRVLLTVSRYSKWQYGDRIQVSGKLQKPENFLGDTGIEFDYISYLAKDGIRYQMFQPKITLVSRGNGNPIKEKLLKIKYAFTGKIEAVIPEPASALMGGILLGSKHSLGKDLLEDFQRAGVIHIVVLSGYNIAIIAEFIMWFFGSLPISIGLTLSDLCILLFVGMTGAGASTIRATIMALIAVLGKGLGKTYVASRALFLAALAMLIYNPLILLSDPSFQLSFLATFGLIYVSPIIEEKFSLTKFIPEKFKIRELVVSTLTTQVFLLPFLLYKTGMFSVVSLLVNLLILAFIPFTMFMGFIAGAIGFISTTFALPFAFLAHIFLSYTIFLSEFFANIPFSVLTTNSFPLWLMVVIYFFYFYYLWRFHMKIPKNL